MVCVDNNLYHLHKTELINNDGIVRLLFTWSHNNYYYVVIIYNYSVFRHNFGLDFRNASCFTELQLLYQKL